MSLKIKLNDKFAEEIEEIVYMKDIDYIDAVIEWCVKNNLEIEVVGKIIRKNKTLLSKIQNDAEQLRYLEKGSRLPI